VVSIYFILSHLTSYNSVIGIIALLGASYLIYSGIELLRIKQKGFEFKSEKKNALKKGVIVNFGSPHPYIFWLSIGVPIIIKSLSISFSAAILFIIGFYSFLVGSKIVVALIVERSKYFINSKHYFLIIRVLGIAQVVFGLAFAKVGLEFLDII